MLKRVLKKVKKLDVSANNRITSLFAGNYRSVFLGRGVEFADLRPYDFGDDVRDIDWKTTSKQGDVFVKKYHESRDNTLFFVFDVSSAMFFSSEKIGKFENALETFAILAFAAVRNGDKVGAMFVDSKKRKIFPPKKGKRNVLKILSAVIETFKENETMFIENHYAEDLRFALKLLKHSSVVFWLSGTLPDLNKNKSLEKVVKMLKHKHDFIPIVFSDREERTLSVRGEMVLQDALTGKTSVVVVNDAMAKEYQRVRQKKKSDFLSFFRKYRMESVFIDESETIFKDLLFFFRKRQKHLI